DVLPQLKADAERFEAPLILDAANQIDPMAELADELRRAISPDAPLSVREGGMIAQGYSDALDELRDISVHGKQYLAEMEQSEREKTGIRNLKIGYNRVFGYYIEVTKSL
ncbi:MAG: DNA mismatch repair protein MutS, partial [Clostridia bacterium]|nr:DNA mismatch repair protein MutS [Clostridia bacterium]